MKDEYVIKINHNSTELSFSSPWDSDLDILIDAFIGMIGIYGFGDKSQIYEHIYNMVHEKHMLDGEFK